MSDTSEKIRSLVLSLLMVTSVFAGVVTLGGVGAVGAANVGSVVSDNTPGGTIGAGTNDVEVIDVEYDPSAGGKNVDNVSLDLGGGNEAANFSASEIGNVTINVNDGALVTTLPYSDNMTLDPNGTVDISRVVVTADIATSADEGTVIDAAHDFNSTTVDSYDTLGNWTVKAGTGFVSGKVTTPSNEPVPNTTIRAEGIDTGFSKETTTDSTGFYTLELPPGEYNLFAEKTNFSTVKPKKVRIEANRSKTRNFVIEPLRFAVSLDVEPGSAQTLAGGTLTYTVTATDNFGNRFEGLQITATDDSPDVTFTSTGTSTATGTTDSNGQTTFTVTSPDPAVATLEFTAGPNAKTNGEELSVTALAEFTPRAGNGTIPGEVKEAPNGEPLEDLEDARVWTVRLEDFNSNKQFEDVDLNAELGTADANTTTSFRLVRLDINATTGVIEGTEVVDNDMYRVQIDEPATDVAVQKENILNDSATSVGGGFYVFDRNGNDNVSIAVTPLVRGNYSLQVANTRSPRPGDFRHVEDYLNGSSTLVDGDGFGLEDENDNDPAADYVSRDLDFETIKQRSDRINTQAYDITDVFGEYGLNDLFVDKQIGINYVVMASKAGYSTDFADTFEWADGYYFDDANKKDIILELRPEPVTPEINITNIALLPNASAAPSDAENPAAYSEYFYSDMSDATSQVVPRSGSTIDVVKVETTAESTGEGINQEVTLSVPDRMEGGDSNQDFNGEWIAVAGGTIISEDPANETITLQTGEDGQAIAWLQTDRASTDLEEVFGLPADIFCEGDEGASGVYAVDPSDPTVDDFTCKEFAGITQSASISGIVTDGENGGLSDTLVWTKVINTNGVADAEFQVNPTDKSSAPAFGGYTQWEVRYEGTDGAFGTSDDIVDSGLSRSDLESYRFTKFPTIVSTEDFTLLTQTDFNTEAKYTLSDVPARGTNALDPDAGFGYRVKGVAAGSGESGFGDADVVVNETDDANIVIDEAEGDFFAINSLDLSPNPATKGDTVTVTATIENTGDVFGDTAVTLFVGGTAVDSTELTEVGFGDPQEVTFEIDTSTLDTGDTTVSVETEDESASDVLTVEAPPEFEVSSLSAPSMVTKGDNVTVSADITNTGSTEATKTVEFRFAGTTLRSEDVTLSAGETTSVNFEVSTDSVSPGTYTHGVFTPDDNETAEITVGGEAMFEVSSVSAPDVSKGETLTITAMVENTGDVEGTQNIEFNVSGEDTATGSGALDIVFTFDNSGTMSDEIDEAKASISEFTSAVESSGADAQYALVSFGDSVTVQSDFTDASGIQSAIDSLGLTGGGDLPENSFGAIDTALNDLSRRSDARPVIIHITDASSHYGGDGSGITSVTRSGLADDLNAANAKFICACYPSGSADEGSVPSEGNVTAMALENVEDGTLVDLSEGNFGDKLSGEIASEVTEAAGGKEVTLGPGESTEVTFNVSTDELATGEYDVTVSSEDTEASTTTNVTESDPVAVYDENGDGNIDDGELENAIVDWSAGDLSDDELQSVIVAWSS